MARPLNPPGGASVRALTRQNRAILLLSIALQLVLGLLFGHNYDMRIFMATGYLVDTGQNPYVAQDLTAVFHNSSFQGMTSVGYPPPWPLVLGFLYRLVYANIPQLLVYNLAIKLPVIAANICLAYLVYLILNHMGASAAVSRRAWVFLLLNPFLLFFASAWGQFDSIVALLSLLSLILLHAGRPGRSAVLLALAISFKPTALPLVLVALVVLLGRPVGPLLRYLAVFLAGMLVFCVAPFVIFGWDPTPILTHWNAHFTVAGAMSFMTFFELLRNSYQLPGNWWLLGLAWIPALAIGALALRPGSAGFANLLKKSLALILVFFLTRTWLSEPNVILILPLVLILTSIGELDRRALAAVWILPLLFTILNASPPQLLFPSFPEAMVRVLAVGEEFRTARLIARIVLVILWQVAGWWIVITCFKRDRAASSGVRA